MFPAWLDMADIQTFKGFLGKIAIKNKPMY